MKIMIYDKDAARNKSLKDKLESYGKVVPYPDIPEEHFKRIEPCDIVFLHANNDQAKKLYGILNTHIPTVVYSGGTDQQYSWFKSGDKCIYLKSIMSAESLYVENFFKEWKKILDKKDGTVPLEYLIKRPSYKNALIILCSASLAAHGGDGLECWDSVPASVREEAKKHKAETERIDWWREALGDISLCNCIGKSGGDIKKLCESILYGTGKIAPDLVKSAYETLSSVGSSKQ